MAAPLEAGLRKTRSGRAKENTADKYKPKATTARADPFWSLLLPISASVLGTAAGYFSSSPLPLSHMPFHSFILGILPLTISVIILRQALCVRGQGLVAILRLTPPAKLPQSGVYSISRFAELSAILLMLASGSICVNTWWGVLFSVALFAFWDGYTVPLLDAELQQRFGLQHKLHAQRTGRWI